LDTGQLDQQGHAGVRGSGGGEGSFELRHLGFGKRQRGEVGLNTHLFEHGHGQLLPPHLVRGREQITGWRHNACPVQGRMQPVARLRRQAAQFLALDDERAQIAHGRRWHPHPFEQACRQQLRERQRGFSIGLHGDLGDKGNVLRMNDHSRMHVLRSSS
jgi:hypothetical protein